jgi:non-specific serine/threonine protein kinase
LSFGRLNQVLKRSENRVSAPYRCGHIEVRFAERQLLIDGRPAAVGARAFDVLVALIERRDRLVHKNELLDLVWPGLFVEVNNLQVQVAALRKLLGRRSITTVPGLGYRFTLAANPIEKPESPSSPSENTAPRPLTAFVGREAELDALTRLLGASRLLSLTGIGGTGKTRLAIELGFRVADRYPDGVRFVDLAPVNSPDCVATEVARVSGVVEEPNRAIEDALVRHVASRRMLLILDNCEHVLDACAALVARLLRESVHLQLVVTSREALGVDGEQIFAVRPLSVPAPGSSVEIALKTEAVQLFVDRARLLMPEFDVSGHDVACVVEICRRLDGIPLALELAAARLRVLSVREIRDKLGDRFRLLTAGSRAISPRQTLEATLQWSYESLAPEEQLLLRRVSVFVGGWTLEAAMAVVGQEAGEIDLVHQLARLVDKSLVVVEHHADGPTRYCMLETVRQYAHERLQESGEAVAYHDAHLAYFLDFVAAAHAQIPTRFAATLTRIDQELANLMAAHAWCEQSHIPAERGLELVARVRRYWIERGQFMLGQQMFAQALRRPGVERRTVQRAEALFSFGQHLHVAGQDPEAVAPLTEALQSARAQHNTGLCILCLAKLSGTHLRLGRRKEARAYAEEAVELARARRARREVPIALDALGTVCRVEGSFDDAAAAYEEAKSSAPGDLGNKHGWTRNLTYVAIGQGRLEYARRLLIECISVGRRYDPQRRLHRDLDVAMHLAAACGDSTRAARIRGAVHAAAERDGVARDALDDPFLAALREKPRQALGEAAYDAAWSAGHALDIPAAFDEVLAWLDEPSPETEWRE